MAKLVAVVLIVHGANHVVRSQVQFFGSSHSEYAHNLSEDVKQQSENRRDFFDNWTEGNWHYNSWRLGLRLEIHNAPQIYAPDQSIMHASLQYRFLEYNTGSLSVRAGHYYQLFRRGLVLRLFENRQLRYDTRMDGLRFDYRNSKFEFSALAGEPINRENQRQAWLQAGELALKPITPVMIGANFLTTQPGDKQRVFWGSVFSQLSYKYGGLYAEYAREDDPNAASNGAALYVNTDFLLGSFSLLLEYKHYDQFQQFQGVYFNNPPLVAREHLYTLLNRHQLIQNAEDEKGYLLEASYPVISEGVLTLHYSLTRSQTEQLLYREYYGQFEWTSPNDWDWFAAAGRQEDPAAQYLNLVGSTTIALSDFNSVKATFEHQHTKRYLNDQQFYSQLLTLSFSRSPGWTISFIGERTTEHDLPRSFWGGVQTDVKFRESLDLTLFAGRRRNGKICAGGVCVIKPELEGVEAVLTVRF